MHRLFTIISAVLLAASAWAAAPSDQQRANSGAQQDQTQKTATEEDVSVTPDKKPAANAKKAQADAVAVMNSVVQARSDISKKNYQAAKDDLSQAQDLLTRVSSEEPGFIVKDRIKTARNKLDYESTDRVVNDFVPIYGDLQEVEAFHPQSEARGHLNKAKQALQKGDKKLGQKELDLASDSITFTQVALPLDEAQKDIKDAQALLYKNNYSSADKALQRLENNLLVSVNEVTAVEKPTIGKADQQNQKATTKP